MGAVVCLRLVSPASVSKETFQEGKISNTHTEGVHIALSSWSLSYPSYRSRKLTMSGFMTRVPSTKRGYLILWLQDGASREEGGSWKRTFRYCIYRLGCLDVIQPMGMSVSLRPSLPTWLATKKRAREHKQLSYDCALNMQGTVMVAHACNLSTRQVETRRSKAQGQI